MARTPGQLALTSLSETYSPVAQRARRLRRAQTPAAELRRVLYDKLAQRYYEQAKAAMGGGGAGGSPAGGMGGGSGMGGRGRWIAA
jgi:hypothetical protein